MSKAQGSRVRKAKKLNTKGLPADQALRAAGQIVDVMLAHFVAAQSADTSEPLTDEEINAHPLLDDAERKLCKIFRTQSKKAGDSFTMLDFACVCLRATGRDYVEAAGDFASTNCVATVIADAKHRRAAVLYVYEALKKGPAIVTETMDDRGTLRDLELLVSHGRLAP
jgi:hypothetical protein